MRSTELTRTAVLSDRVSPKSNNECVNMQSEERRTQQVGNAVETSVKLLFRTGRNLCVAEPVR